MIRVEQIDRLPLDVRVLRDEADCEGVNNMGLLVDQWASGEQRFSKLGEALFAAFDGDRLVGVGGVTREGALPAMRMRRLYVLGMARRRRVGRGLAGAMIARGFESADLLTCNARATPQAAPFWETMGFEPVATRNHTHERRR
jgi:GNAT superfamily N-acetyltransferase